MCKPDKDQWYLRLDEQNFGIVSCLFSVFLCNSLFHQLFYILWVWGKVYGSTQKGLEFSFLLTKKADYLPLILSPIVSFDIYIYIYNFKLCRPAKEASSNNGVECVCKCKEACCWWRCNFYLVGTVIYILLIDHTCFILSPTLHYSVCLSWQVIWSKHLLTIGNLNLLIEVLALPPDP